MHIQIKIQTNTDLNRRQGYPGQELHVQLQLTEISN